ncbi:5'-AMP-activated protein kinase subunit beta-2 [Goodea atripinnis]|uniref:5'-AMP-activated protein kinase subunit beta-2 n=1 Tax=Goodea atripinnis TaxID=208336 RepID=A0ABV0PF12_9TELE
MGNTSDRVSADRHGKAQRSDSSGSHKDQESGSKMVDSTDDPNVFNMHGPESKPVVTSQLGTINNLITVKKSDFEVFDALQVDSLECSDTSGPYGQDQYIFRQEEHFKAPPILPPHLLQVILNKDTNVSDGVMVLSATHRYKKKYVTSLLYKPI